MSSNAKIYTLGMVGVACIIGLCLVAIFSTDAETARLITFFGAMTTTLSGLVFTAAQVSKVQSTTAATNDKVDAVAQRVNGQLDANFAAVHDAIQQVADSVNAVPDPVSTTPVETPTAEDSPPDPVAEAGK